ncbi:monocarboxylate permease-like protein [Lindgomyces ingoldianus]|uniref:Monocarboxylate permease-like protein n=1 Tax=Lindgomyces ingoldianus TaxID=673940 RepID=A0ACB6RDN4_9PLEO|nr:monocarboxylate permease-like protein [Lindgomyces ingoldianus]KAF2477301.1 monocarboxylate permease-like protein [Lindgomyces ingoldianus]
MTTAGTGHEVSHEVEEQKSINPADLDEETTTPNSSGFGEAPDGGLRAWLVAAGAACIFFSCLGFSNAFGVFQEYYITHQLHEESPDRIAWIGSLSVFIQFAAGSIGGPLFDRLGAWVIRPAAVLYIFALMMTSLSTEYWHFMLTQGILMGIVMAFLQFPAFAAVSQYFDKRRAAALGIVVSGSSIGGVVIPIALAKMLNSSSLGFGWSVRVIGFLITPLMAFACVVINARLPPRQTHFFISAPFKEARYVLLIVSLFFMFLGMFAPLFFIPTYAVTRGMNATLASYLLAILNAASTLGRIIPGILADKYGPLNIFAVAGVITGVVILCMDWVETTAAFVIYSIVVGFFSGTIISGASAAFSRCAVDPRDLGTYMGMGMAVASLAALIGPPVNGVLVHRYGGFLQVSIFSGIMCLVGGFAALVSKMATPQGILGKI